MCNITKLFQPILTSLRGTKIQQNPTKPTNLLLQAKQAGQNVQRRITKPIVGKLVSNPRAQLPVDSVLTNRKLSSVPQGNYSIFNQISLFNCIYYLLLRHVIENFRHANIKERSTPVYSGDCCSTKTHAIKSTKYWTGRLTETMFLVLFLPGP